MRRRRSWSRSRRPLATGCTRSRYWSRLPKARSPRTPWRSVVRFEPSLSRSGLRRISDRFPGTGWTRSTRRSRIRWACKSLDGPEGVPYSVGRTVSLSGALPHTPPPFARGCWLIDRPRPTMRTEARQSRGSRRAFWNCRHPD